MDQDIGTEESRELCDPILYLHLHPPNRKNGEDVDGVSLIWIVYPLDRPKTNRSFHTECDQEGKPDRYEVHNRDEVQGLH